MQGNTHKAISLFLCRNFVGQNNFWQKKKKEQHWQKIPDTQKGSPFSSKGGQNKKDKKRQKS